MRKKKKKNRLNNNYIYIELLAYDNKIKRYI